MPRVASDPLPPQGLPSPSNIDDAHRFINRARPAPEKSRDSERPGIGLTAVQAAVAHAVVEHDGYGKGWCYASVVTLHLTTKLSVRTVAEALRGLVARGWLATDIHVKSDGRKPKSFAKYRLTPLAIDLLTDEEVTAVHAKAAADSAKRVAAHRAKRRDEVPPCNGTERITPPDVTATGAAYKKEISVDHSIAQGRDPGSTTPNPYVDPPPRYDPRNPASYKVIDGIRVPLVARGEAGLLEPRVTILIGHLLPGRERIAYPVSVLAAEHRLPLTSIAWALRRLVDTEGTDVSGDAVSKAIDDAPEVRGSRRAEVERWLKQTGITRPLQCE